ncbi:unnamed protein product [Fraxinus pennsylvanica]|uniref:Uncharacterized protein n=1 Tax=Fraxinus pennsylvanica TaxID=56036 RepID=A0AAD1Z2C4_9LAMI|nr:unnamed protein product [Fraxinus pennsylvanica]
MHINKNTGRYCFQSKLTDEKKMAIFCRNTVLRFFVFFGLLSHQFCAANFISSPSDHYSAEEIGVGVIVDMGSWVGKTIHACISMSISDFYELNGHYRTRIILDARDSRGKPLRALSAGQVLKIENSRY